MPDFLDHVQDRLLAEQEALQAQRLASVPVPSPRGTVVFCVACGDAIDPRRVMAVAGVKRCIVCESISERSLGLR